MSASFKTEHYEMVLKAGDMERSARSCLAPEEPRVGQSYPNFYAAKLASKFVKVVLAGAEEMSFLEVILGAIIVLLPLRTLKST